ncbi:unnamed protein product [Penicillium salamii]|uniref:WD40 repeat-like protein n=1 Tax=Penicillium salamii TaxID=1612424 RepID=A0A9W4JM88_9EURO|nr:unnamed protein product [Penicillium salamii]
MDPDHRKKYKIDTPDILCWSPDGATIALCSDEYLWLLDTVTGHRKLLGQVEPGTCPIPAVAFSPDGKYIALGAGYNSTIYLWNFAMDAHELRFFKLGRGKVSHLAFDPEGTRIIVLVENLIPHLNLESGSYEEYELESTRATEEGSLDHRFVALSSDCRRIVSIEKASGFIAVWDQFGHKIGYLDKIDKILSVYDKFCISRDGHLFVTTSFTSGTIWIWDIRGIDDQGSAQRVTRAHKERVNSVVHSPDLQTVATISRDGSIRLWDLNGSHRPFEFQIDRDATVSALAFSPKGLIIASGHEHAVQLWDYSTGDCLMTLDFKSDVTRLAFTPDSSTIVYFTHNGMGSFDARTGCRQKKSWMKSHYKGNSVFAQDGRSILVHSDDGRLQMWSLTAEQHPDSLVAELPIDYHDEINTLAVSVDGSIAACGFQTGRTGIWDLSLETMILLGSEQDVDPGVKLALSPDSKRLAISSAEGVIFWDLATLQQRSLPDRRSPLVFSPTGEYWVSGQVGLNGVLSIWDAETDAKMFDLNISDGHFGDTLDHTSNHTSDHTSEDMVDDPFAFTAVAFTSDGAKMAAGSRNGEIYVWDLVYPPSLSRKLQVQTGPNEITALAFSPDSMMLASGSSREVSLFNISAQAPDVMTIGENNMNIQKLLFSSDGGSLLSIGVLRGISRWDVKTGALAQSFESNRCLDHSAFDNQRYFKMDQRPVEPVPGDAMLCPHHQKMSDIQFKGEWISCNGEDLLWLPPDRRPENDRATSSRGDSLVIGSHCGKMSFCNFVPGYFS